MNQEGKVPLTLAYQRYIACNKAMQDFNRMKAAKTWPSTCPEPTATDIIEIFISKSMWHQYYVALFSHISRYPDMVEWLEDGEDRPSSVDVWGLEKTSYTFSDLKKWLNEQKSSLAADVEEKMDKKEKGKEKRRKRGKRLKNIVLQRRVLQRVPPEKRRKLVKGNGLKVEILRMRTVMQGRIKKGSRRQKEATRRQRRIGSK
jgi:hypothetical protein